YKEFQMYFSKHYNNIAVEYNYNLLVEYNNNSGEDHDENSMNNQSFYTESLQESIELLNTIYDDNIYIKAEDTFFLKKL
ncbi:10157_t:CDS:1, partial [Racocetra persica]